MRCIYSINSTVYSESEYVFYYLDELMKVSSDIYICISSFAEEQLKQRIFEYALPVYEYESFIDVNRWKDVIVNHIGQTELARLKGLLLVNDSVFGPFWPMSDIFDAMKQRKCDFWGMTKHSSMKMGEVYYPPYIQLYFCCFNRKILSDKRFFSYWNSLPEYFNLTKASAEFEFVFTAKLEKMGFISDSYVNTTDIEHENPNFFLSFILFGLYRLVSEKKYPFIPKYIFEIEKKEMLNYHDGNDLRKTIAYVKKKSSYDLSLIFHNIIKRINLSDLISRLNLYYILDDSDTAFECKKNNNAIFSYLFYEELFEYSIKKILMVPEEFDIFIATDSALKAQLLSKIIKRKSNRAIKIVVTGGRGRDIASLLVTFKKEIVNYKIIGFIHDKKSRHLNYQTIGDSYNLHLWENMLYGPNYIKKILKIFDNNLEIGFLSPDYVTYGNYFHTSINLWTICYEDCLKIAEKLGLQVDFDKNKNPVSLGSCFWARVEALDKLFDLSLNYSDFPGEPFDVDGTISHVIERLIPYIAQDKGYLTGYISCVSQAETEIVMHEYMLDILLKALFKGQKLDYSTFNNMINSIETNRGEEEK